MQRHSEQIVLPSTAPTTSIDKSQDRSIDVISGDELDKGGSKQNEAGAGSPDTQKSLSETQKSLSETQKSSSETQKSSSEKSERKSSERSKSEVSNSEAPCLSWLNPLGKPKAIILCVHGLGLHSGSYEQFGKAMSQ
ncbi:MAG: lysophospholipase, partial [Candidatus Obscuribacterales bacterium]|nr:lysophospholipase [Candidatus Obscuribacterales bacterium]